LGDRDRFLSLLDGAYRKYSGLVYVYTLMDNHYHLLMETERENLSRIMHYLNVSHSIYFNRRHRRSGHLFQGRYKSVLVDKEPYVLEVSRYIHLNTDRAGIGDKLRDPRWTSYVYYIGAREKPEWLCTDWLIDRFGGDWPTVRRRYREFVEKGLKGAVRNPFEDVYKGVILGGKGFVDMMKGRLEEKIAEDREISGYKSLSTWYAIRDIVDIVCSHFGVEPDVLRKRKWNLLPRKVVMYLARKYTDSSLREIGDYFKVSYSAVSQNACQVAHDRDARRAIEELTRQLER